jgi:hypothetical protein
MEVTSVPLCQLVGSCSNNVPHLEGLALWAPGATGSPALLEKLALQPPRLRSKGAVRQRMMCELQEGRQCNGFDGGEGGATRAQSELKNNGHLE